MFDRESVARQVLRNCQVTDAGYAGSHSVCGLALRLRDLYKWEKGLAPWIEEDSPKMLEWIGEKEDIWEGLAERELKQITLCGQTYDPFDTRAINAILEPQGLFYGAGYVQGLRPTFFLALLDEKTEVEGYPVYFLGTELARDLLTLPALIQDDGVLIRKDSAALYLYNQIFFIQKSGRRALDVALECFGLNGKDPEALHHSLDRITEAELETYLYHELGELREGIFDRITWREIVSTYPYTPVELLARSVKDLLADTHPGGLLHHMIKGKKKASLAMYVAFLDGMRKELFPEIITAFDGVVSGDDWHGLRKAVSAGFKRSEDLAKAMCRIYREAKDKDNMKWGEREMKRRLLVPLGIVGEDSRGAQ